MDTESTRADVEARLREASEAMSDRFDSLQEEVATTGTTIRDWAVRNPWKSVGGMLAAGVAVGALFGGRGSRRRPEHAELLEQYIQALRADVDDAIATGDTPGRAVEKALRGGAPLVVYREGNAGEETGAGGSFLGTTVGFVARLAFREVIREFILSTFEDVDVEGMIGGEDLE